MRVIIDTNILLSTEFAPDSKDSYLLGLAEAGQTRTHVVSAVAMLAIVRDADHNET